jgi:hypothetical protein
MGIPLVHPAKGAESWFPAVDGNWKSLESFFLAREKSDTSIATVSGTTAETALMANTTIPANTLAAGTVIPLWAAGSITVPSTTTGTVTLRLRWGGVSGVILATWTLSFGSNPSAYTVGWVSDWRIVGITTGASGTAESDGWLGTSNDTIHAGLVTGTATLDTTTSKTLLWTAQLSATTLSASQRQMVTEVG